MIMNLITGVIGIALLATFLGILLWWIKAVPLVVIMALVFLLLIYDFLRTLRYGENGARR
jgi:hypothetical protein